MIHPKLIRRRGTAQKQIKAIMKRVSKENIKPVGRSIGKLSHCSPGFLFDYVSSIILAILLVTRNHIFLFFSDFTSNSNLRQSNWSSCRLTKISNFIIL